MPDAVIAADVRSPITIARKGALAGVRPDDRARAVLQRTGRKLQDMGIVLVLEVL